MHNNDVASNPPEAEPTLEDRLDALRSRFDALFPGKDGDVVDLVYEIAEVAHGMAVSMLDSDEFKNRIEAAIVTRALVIAKRAAFDLLASKEFTDRLMTWHKAYKQPSLNSEEFSKKVMEIAWPDVSVERHSVILALLEFTEKADPAHLPPMTKDQFEQKIRTIVDEHVASNLKSTLRSHRRVTDDEDTGA